jgi:hypothetical protein
VVLRRIIVAAVPLVASLTACAALPPATAAADRSLAAGRSCAKLPGHRLKSGSKIKLVVPAGSLSLSGHTVTWQNAGSVRTATL